MNQLIKHCRLLIVLAMILIVHSNASAFALEKSIAASVDAQIKITQNIVESIKEKENKDLNINHKVIPLAVPILMFHHISDEKNASLTADTFRRYMTELKEGGYETIFYEDLYGFVNGKNDLPEKPVIVTFDDGYESNYLYAYPILKGLGMKAEISLIGSSVGLDKNPLTHLPIIPHFSWEKAKEMVDSGFVRIRSHSFELHQHVSAEEVDRLGVIKNTYESPEYYNNMFAQDTRLMKSLIKEQLNYEDLAYTYPYGKYNLETEAMLRNMKYKITITTDTGINQVRIGDFNALRLMKRIPCDTNSSQNIIERIHTYK